MSRPPQPSSIGSGSTAPSAPETTPFDDNASVATTLVDDRSTDRRSADFLREAYPTAATADELKSDWRCDSKPNDKMHLRAHSQGVQTFDRSLGDRGHAIVPFEESDAPTTIDDLRREHFEAIRTYMSRNALHEGTFYLPSRLLDNGDYAVYWAASLTRG